MANLAQFLNSQPVFKILFGLLHSSEPLHLRGLSAQLKISASGVSDILRRLKKAGVLQEKRVQNKRCLSLKISDQEREALELLFTEAEAEWLKKRAKVFSKNAQEKLEWMDQAYRFYREIK